MNSKIEHVHGWAEVIRSAELFLAPVFERWVLAHSGLNAVDLEFYDLVATKLRVVCTVGQALEADEQQRVEVGSAQSALFTFYGHISPARQQALAAEVQESVLWLISLQKTALGSYGFEATSIIMYQASKIEGRWVLVHANAALGEFLGIPVEDFIGRYAKYEMLEFIHPDDRQKLVSSYDFTRSTTQQMSVQYRLLSSSGDYVPVTERIQYTSTVASQRCDSVIWHRPLDQVDSQYQFDIFKRLEAFTEDISLETGRNFLSNLARRFGATENVDRLTLSTKANENWWESWTIMHKGAQLPNFSFIRPEGLNTQQAKWNITDLPSISAEERALLFGDDKYLSIVPVCYEGEPIEGVLYFSGSKPLKDTDLILQVMRLLGLRILRELMQIRIADAEKAQNVMLVRQKYQLTKMVTLLGYLDTVSDEQQFLKAAQEHLIKVFGLSAARWVYWSSGDWQEIRRFSYSSSNWLDGSSLVSDDDALDLLEQSRRLNRLSVHKARQVVYWPIGQFEAGYLVIILDFATGLPDLELLEFSRNALALSLQGLVQRENLRRQAMRDSLTDLGNRVQLHAWMKVGLPNSSSASLLLFDLNRFKEINDSFGHQFGDKLLREIGPRIASRLSEVEHYIARLGGDEFALFFPNIKPEHATAYGRILYGTLAESYLIEGLRFQVEASVGIAHYPLHGSDGHELLRCADVAMYDAKKSGRDVIEFSEALDTTTPLRIAVLSELESALKEDQLWVAYQPLMSTKTGLTAGFEALIRWTHPKFGPLSPTEFISIAEMGEGIRRITDFVLRSTLESLQGWRKIKPDLHVALNVSPRVLLDHQFPINIQNLLTQYDLPGSAVVLELTESTLLIDPIRAVEIITSLSQLGINVEIDDFGTGYSSLAYLKRLPISALKIDRSFVTDILTDPQNEVIVGSTVQMAHNLGLQTVAEGVEDEATLLKMMKLGCDLIQGYYYSKPMPSNEVTGWLKRNL